MDSHNSGDHHGNNDNNHHYHTHGSIIADNPHLGSSPLSFHPGNMRDHKLHSINSTEGYPTASSYSTSHYPPSSAALQLDRNISIVPLQHSKLDPNSSEGSNETWTRVSATETSAPATFPFGSYTTKPTRTYDERALDSAFFTNPSMKMPSNTVQPSMSYFSGLPPPMGYNPHQVNYGNTMPPTPQDYPMSMTAMQNQNGNDTRIMPPQFHGQNPNRPPPVPAQTMMTTFNSKTVSSTPKRYKCNICQKRFTRPSSLQTHTYSHTGEKLEGCGRHFSVVSNLRRHQKIHSK
ncbi:4392_t:CDS:2 [Gigaspora margarita]|uniref:4392_t:CDS:1 n=1 Tax=Gigaspora margarita TaxID=4874 RepID=A0ABN7VHX3_GIGMA|nr:4392_t:CDS:2 [Gigaspora margarita]